MPDDIQIANGSRKAPRITGHSSGEQEKMPEGERENGERTPCSQVLGPFSAGVQQQIQGRKTETCKMQETEKQGWSCQAVMKTRQELLGSSQLRKAVEFLYIKMKFRE